MNSEKEESEESTFLSLRGGSGAITEVQWIATGYTLAMTRVVFYHEGNEEIVVLTLSLRGRSGARDAAIHRVSGVA